MNGVTVLDGGGLCLDFSYQKRDDWKRRIENLSEFMDDPLTQNSLSIFYRSHRKNLANIPSLKYVSPWLHVLFYDYCFSIERKTKKVFCLDRR